MRKLNFTLCDLVLWPPLATGLAVYFYTWLDWLALHWQEWQLYLSTPIITGV